MTRHSTLALYPPRSDKKKIYPNARGHFSKANAEALLVLHREYDGVGTSVGDWNVGRWVVIRGVTPGVYYGKMMR